MEDCKTNLKKGDNSLRVFGNDDCARKGTEGQIHVFFLPAVSNEHAACRITHLCTGRGNLWRFLR